MQQASVELSPAGIAWMNEQIERAFARHGKLTERELSTLDWPDGFKG
jgi:hypothetical protein